MLDTAHESSSFSYHKESGAIALYLAFIFVICIETIALHIWIAKWSVVFAWGMTSLSLYSILEIARIIYTIVRRSIEIQGEHVILNYGILGSSTISLTDIATVECVSSDLEFNEQLVKLNPLMGPYNIVITSNRPQSLKTLYGSKKTYSAIALFVDEKTHFHTALTKAIQNK